MTRKDYIALADALLGARNESRGKDMLQGVVWAVEYVADALARDNPRFDRQRFLKAAGVQS